MRLSVLYSPIGFFCALLGHRPKKNSNSRNNYDCYGYLEMRLSVLDPPPRFYCAYLGRRPKKNVHFTHLKMFI